MNEVMTEIIKVKLTQKEQKSQRNPNKKRKIICSRCSAEIRNDNNTGLCDACNEYYGTKN